MSKKHHVQPVTKTPFVLKASQRVALFLEKLFFVVPFVHSLRTLSSLDELMGELETNDCII
jgi:hypothetical protein